jgi:hypothetical protein
MKRITPAIAERLVALGISPAAHPDVMRAALATTAREGVVRDILGSGTKTDLNYIKLEALTAVVYMSPADEAGINLCPMAGSCSQSCLGWSTGSLRYHKNMLTRISKSLLWHLFPATFLRILGGEIVLHAARAEALGVQAAVRLNGSTDILWERHLRGLMMSLSTVRFYDYTKHRATTREGRPHNYHLTYSIDEQPHSWEEATRWLDSGGNAALVVGGPLGTSRKAAKAAVQRLIATGYRGYPVIDGDQHDARWADEPGHVVALYAKGAALTDTSGFVHRVSS